MSAKEKRSRKLRKKLAEGGSTDEERPSVPPSRKRAEKDPRQKRFDVLLASAIVLLLAGSAVLIAVPRNASPHHIPAPRIDWATHEANKAEEQALAREAQTEVLDVDVRAVGGELRKYNLAAAQNDQMTLMEVRTSLVRAVYKALPQGDRPLQALRAYQAYRFVEELHAWTKSGEVSEELRALGGDFITALERNAWCGPPDESGGRTLLMSDDVLVALYKDRWNDLTGLGQNPAFALTVDENRLRFGFLLAFPFRKKLYGPAEAELTAFKVGQARLATITKLTAVDPAYPAAYARGIVHFQMGRWELASAAFKQHLEEKEDGPYTLRARNYLRNSLSLIQASR